MNNIFAGFEGRSIIIESGAGHRRAGVLKEVTVDEVGLAVAHLERAIRVLEEDWYGPRKGEYRWCGDLRIASGPHLVVMPMEAFWGDDYELPESRAEVIEELEGRV